MRYPQEPLTSGVRMQGKAARLPHPKAVGSRRRACTTLAVDVGQTEGVVAVVLDLQLVFLIEPDFADRRETSGALTVLIDIKHDDAEDRKVGRMAGVHRATALGGKDGGWQGVRRLCRASDETRSVDGGRGVQQCWTRQRRKERRRHQEANLTCGTRGSCEPRSAVTVSRSRFGCGRAYRQGELPWN